MHLFGRSICIRSCTASSGGYCCDFAERLQALVESASLDTLQGRYSLSMSTKQVIVRFFFFVVTWLAGGLLALKDIVCEYLDLDKGGLVVGKSNCGITASVWPTLSFFKNSNTDRAVFI